MRPLLVGLDNPYSTAPAYALHPKPMGGSGDRLYEVIREAAGVRRDYQRSDYLRDFSRINLYPSSTAPDGKGSAEMDTRMAEWLYVYVAGTEAAHVVLLGNRVQAAAAKVFNLPRNLEPLEHYRESIRVQSGSRIGVSFWAIPHPSGRNRWYNETARRAEVGKLLYGLAQRATAARTMSLRGRANI